jgi:hypothetical protein
VVRDGIVAGGWAIPPIVFDTDAIINLIFGYLLLVS